MLDELMFKPGLLMGERILITGGGTGLGRQIAEAYLSLGAEVYICGRRGAVLEATAQSLSDQHGGRVVPIVCDIRSVESILALVDRIWADGGALTGLVNNAAGNFISRTEDISPKGFDAIANIVFRGAFILTQECGKRWIAEQRKASVLSILVSWVWNGGPFTVPSAMSKAAINIMTKSLAVEWGYKGIRFNAIAPGAFPTEGTTARLRPGEAGQIEHGVSATNPLGRVGAMSELANLAVFLMAPGAEYLNGQTIAIDGGQDLVRGSDEMRFWTDEQWATARSAIKAADDRDRSRRTT